MVTTWKWWNFLKQTVPPGKQLVTINLDETYVGYYQGLFKGNLAVTKKSWPITQKPLSQPASRSQLRTGLTHVGLLCDVPSAQRLLPQMLIASEKVSTTSRWSFVAIASSEMLAESQTGGRRPTFGHRLLLEATSTHRLHEPRCWQGHK